MKSIQTQVSLFRKLSRALIGGNSSLLL